MIITMNGRTGLVAPRAAPSELETFASMKYFVSIYLNINKLSRVSRKPSTKIRWLSIVSLLTLSLNLC